MGRQSAAPGASAGRIVRTVAAFLSPFAAIADATHTAARLTKEAPHAMVSSRFVAMPGMTPPGAVVAPGAAPGVPLVLTPEQERVATEESSRFVGAMVKAFLNRERLQKGELDCITDGSKDVGGELGRLASQLGMMLEQTFGGHIPGVPEVAEPHVDGHASGEDTLDAAAKEVDPKPRDDPSLNFFYDSIRRLEAAPGLEPVRGSSELPASAMGAFPFAMELGYNMRQIVQQTHELVGKCVHSDARAAFRTAGEHMRNLNYMTGHILANGADIVKEFADSVLAYEERNATRFGKDVGVALRKVFLSNTAEGRLPEGSPSDAELANVTGGLLRGFFGEGTEMDIGLRGDPKSPVRIDMQQCVGKNLQFFQGIWASTMYLFAQKAVGADAMRTGSVASPKGEAEFMTMLSFTMLELPGAMKKCNIDADQRQMILDSLKAMGTGMSASFRLPAEDTSRDAFMGGFAQTVEDWSDHRWYEFGLGLGNFLRKSLVAHFPQKYSVGPGGMLLRLAQEPVRAGGTVALLLSGLALVLAVVAFAVHRRWVAVSRRSGQRDLEAGGNAEELLFIVE